MKAAFLVLLIVGFFVGIPVVCLFLPSEISIFVLQGYMVICVCLYFFLALINRGEDPLEEEKETKKTPNQDREEPHE